ncbi:MAG: response regulator, partial [bacterium]|nr:response regulator [Candidatus Kapabacteria bacterium]
WNDSAERLFGYTPSEMLGQNIALLSTPEQRDELNDIFAKIRRGEPINNLETVRTTKGGEGLHVSMSISPIADSSSVVRGVTSIVQDISERRQVRAELELLSRRKDEFLAMLSHELRNPLAPILSGLEVIRDAGDDPGLVETAVGIIERQTIQMVRLVDDLLDVSRITNGAIRLRDERVDIRSVIAMAMETSRGQIEGARITYEVSVPDEPVYVVIDPARITQVVVNLLSNSAKYTESGGHIWLSTEAFDGMMVIAVRDTGIGIAPDMLSSIFEIFTQIESGRRHARGGLGVGLSVVKTLVEMHGGTVEARSDGEGKGSEFTIRLPLAKDQRTAQPDIRPQLSLDDDVLAAQVIPSRILIVDDNVDAAQMLYELLTHDKHDVRIATDGMTAIAEAATFKPEVCLLDIGLPDISGYEVAERIRATDPTVMLIALTGWGQEEDRARSREAGFDHHIIKPIESAVLKRLLALPRSDARSK